MYCAFTGNTLLLGQENFTIVAGPIANHSTVFLSEEFLLFWGKFC